MKTIAGKLKGSASFILFISIAFMTITSCSKEGSKLGCDQCTVQPPYQLIVDFPPIQTPGYLTLMKATVLGDITYPISITWYTSREQYPQGLQQVDTLISGNKAWFSFLFPAIYKGSQYNEGPYNVRCVVNKINPVDVETLVEKTVRIKVAQ